MHNIKALISIFKAVTSWHVFAHVILKTLMFFWPSLFIVIASSALAFGLYVDDAAVSSVMKVTAIVFVLLALIAFAGLYYTKSTIQKNNNAQNDETGLLEKDIT